MYVCMYVLFTKIKNICKFHGIEIDTIRQIRLQMSLLVGIISALVCKVCSNYMLNEPHT